jgi:hypothetical protein
MGASKIDNTKKQLKNFIKIKFPDVSKKRVKESPITIR